MENYQKRILSKPVFIYIVHVCTHMCAAKMVNTRREIEIDRATEGVWEVTLE